MGEVRGAPDAALPAALLFDRDGVLVDTEKDDHRISFNETFAEVRLLRSINFRSSF
jgi:beta-phosphoglucomutase-like phosphatase (HAD superfamily)